MSGAQSRVLRDINTAMRTLNLSQANGQGGGRRRNRRRRRRRGVATAPVPGTSSRPATINAMGQFSGTSMRFTHEELLCTIKADTSGTVKNYDFIPRSTGLPVLDKLAAVFERYKAVAVTVFYRPIVGTTTDGAVVVACDWDALTDATTLAQLYSMSPHIRGPVYQSQSMVFPMQRLNAFQSYYMSTSAAILLKAPFSICTAAKTGSDKEVGEVWVRYTILFEGVSAVN